MAVLKRDGFQGNGGTTQSAAVSSDSSSGFDSSSKKKRWDQPDAWLLLNGEDKALYTGEIAYLKIGADGDKSKFWRVALEKASLGNSYYDDCRTTAKFSSGSRSILVPPSKADALNKAIGAEYNAITRRYELDCDKIPVYPLTFGFEGYNVGIPSSVYTTKTEGVCYTLINRNLAEGSEEWIIGSSLSNSFYTIYDFKNEQVGIAKLIHGAEGATISKA